MDLAASCKKYCKEISRVVASTITLRQHLGMLDVDRTIFEIFGDVLVILRHPLEERFGFVLRLRPSLIGEHG
jgi:hypothetical protein